MKNQSVDTCLATGAATALDAEFDAELRKQLDAVRIKDGNLLISLADMSRRLGVPTPRLYMAERFPPMFGGAAPNMMAFLHPQPSDGGAIAMTRSYLDLFHYSPGGEVPVEIRASLGHELGHMKQGFAYLEGVRRYPPLVGMVGALAGLYLYDRAKSAGADKARQAAALEAEVADARHALGQAPKGSAAESIHHAQHAALNGGHYLAAGALGLSGGLLVTRQAMLELEYDADRVGATLSGDPQAMIRSLQSFDRHIRNMPKAAQLDLVKNISAHDVFDSLFVHAHPSTELRVDRLLKMAQEMERETPAALVKAVRTIGHHLPPLL